MIKKKAFLLVILLIVLAAPAEARIRYGVKGGMSVTSLHFNQSNIVNADNLMAYQVGPFSEWMFSRFGIGVDLAVLYSQKGLEFHSKRFTTNYIDIPLNLKWKVGLPLPIVNKGWLAAGPYMAFALGDKQWDRFTTSSARVTANSKDYGVNFEAGVELLNHIQVGFLYSLGISDGYEVTRTSGLKTYAQNRGWAITAGFMF
ncbi:MAG: PorT family protein [Tannerellaceae bacterium]|nr:PorT family protein [Tannerellaceae bacterium]